MAGEALVGIAALLSLIEAGVWIRRRRQPRTSAILEEKHADFDDPHFQISSQLLEGKHEVIKLPLCTVLVCDDRRYPWLVLVPRQAHAIEILDLNPEKQTRLWQEVSQACEIVKSLAMVEKLNVATLGNVCSQLHIHVTGRYRGDASWPGPCYGVGSAVPFVEAEVKERLADWRNRFEMVCS